MHGLEAVVRVRSDAALRFGGALSFAALASVEPAAVIDPSELERGLSNTELLVRAGLVKSKSEGARVIEQGGVTINDEAVSDARGAVRKEQLIGGVYLKVAKGRRGVAVVKIAEN